MDDWAWEQLEPWLRARVKLPVGPLSWIVNGPTRGRPWTAGAARSELRRVAREAGVRRRFAPHQLRHAHAPGTGGSPRQAGRRSGFRRTTQRLCAWSGEPSSSVGATSALEGTPG